MSGRSDRKPQRSANQNPFGPSGELGGREPSGNLCVDWPSETAMLHRFDWSYLALLCLLLILLVVLLRG
jgi:hypothetical protein